MKIFSNKLSVRGFTLIELMITIAIIAILMSVALPSYRESVQRGDRASARAVLLEAQQYMERFYAVNDAYNQDKAGVAVALPARLQTAPVEAPKYNIAISASAANSYTLTATPIAADKCGNLTLTNAGVKGRTGTALSVADCWK
jgi:type IV pilus assembly protein PilE